MRKCQIRCTPPQCRQRQHVTVAIFFIVSYKALIGAMIAALSFLVPATAIVLGNGEKVDSVYTIIALFSRRMKRERACA